MSNKKSSQKGVQNWPTWKLLSVYLGSMIIFFLLLYLMLSIGNTLFGYVVDGLYILLGLAMVIRAETIGSTLFEGNRRMLRFIWRRIFMMREENVQKKLYEIVESGPLGLEFHIFITPFVGAVLIFISVLSIIWLSRGMLFD